MTLPFTKYQATGNDFIIFDNRSKDFPENDINLIERLCDRKFGIGADGLILLQDHNEVDYEMIYFNSDGSKSLCGNGSRAGFAYAKEIKLAKEKAVFETTDGIHKIESTDNIIKFQLFDNSLPIRKNADWYLDTGSPHYILETSHLDEVDILSEGRKIRYSEEYVGQNGTNVNFAQFLPDRIKMRTYERGVENETLSCGTAATAVALVGAVKGMKSPVKLETKGGDLEVYFKNTENGFTDIWLAGPAVKVFEGTITI